MKTVLRILLADNQLRHSAASQIRAGRYDWAIIDASNDLDALRLANTQRPDVLVLGADLSGLEAPGALALLTAGLPAVPVLMTCGEFSEDVISRALAARVRGVLLRASAENDLERAIEAVVAGESYFCPVVAKWLLQ